MTRYFLKGTPLAGLEREMMTPPRFSPRGGGQMILCRFRYRPEDVVCKHCTKYRRGGCALPVCPWLEERIEAGVVTYSSLAAEFCQKWRDSELGIRIEELLSVKKSVSFLDFSHAVRLTAYNAYLAHHHKDGNGNRRLAALYLLTAEAIWITCGHSCKSGFRRSSWLNRRALISPGWTARVLTFAAVT